MPVGFARRSYVLSGRRPKPDVGNLVRDQAHAPLPLPAGHARMPPGPSKADDRVTLTGFPRPNSWLSQERGQIARMPREGKSNVRVSDATFRSISAIQHG